MRSSREVKIAAKIIVMACAVLLFGWFCIPFFYHIFGAGQYVGMLVSALIFLYFPVKYLFQKIFTKKTNKIIFWTIHGIAIICAVYVAVLSGIMFSGFHNTAPETGDDTVVVFGALVVGQNVTYDLGSRLDAAVSYLNAHPESKCVVSGGQGSNESYPEAVIMKQYLLSKGIADGRVAVEDQSTDTAQNLQNSMQLITQNGWNQTIVIATSDYHMYRALQIAKNQEIEAYALPAKTPWFTFPSDYSREILSLTKYFFHL